MSLYGSITSPVSVPRLLIGALLAVGVYLIWYAFSRFGLAAGAAVALAPLGLCGLWFSLRNPAVAMLTMFAVNYYLMTLTRYMHDKPFGVILDAMLALNLLLVVVQSIVRGVEWRRARTGLTLASALWLVYCFLQLVNPESVSSQGWFMAVRSLAIYFFLTVVLTQITLARYKYLKYMLVLWSVLTLTAVAKALIQKYVGFNAAENYWLFVLGGRTTHLIRTGVRYFSFFSDAANFGAGMGLSMVVFSIAALYYRSAWMKFYFFAVAALACYGMLISGTRSALAVPFVGYTLFVMLSRNIRMIVAGCLVLVGAFVFLNFTTWGSGNALVRRARSAFNTQDASFQVRLQNQAKLRELMRDKPFGAGLGHGGGKAKVFAPDSPLSQIPTDSWYVMVWVETGVVGILLHAGILLYVLAWGSWQVVFRLRDTQLRGLTAALVCGIAGIVVMAYGNEVLGQMPTGIILYMSMGFVFLAPRFDRELMEARTAKPPLPPGRQLAAWAREATAFPGEISKTPLR